MVVNTVIDTGVNVSSGAIGPGPATGCYWTRSSYWMRCTEDVYPFIHSFIYSFIHFCYNLLILKSLRRPIHLLLFAVAYISFFGGVFTYCSFCSLAASSISHMASLAALGSDGTHYSFFCLLMKTVL